MRKILGLALSIVIAVSLTSCGKLGNESAGNPTSTKTAVADNSANAIQFTPADVPDSIQFRGIGTANPNALLQINKTVGGSVVDWLNLTTSDWAAEGFRFRTDNGFINRITVPSGGDFYLEADGSAGSSLQLKNDGNIALIGNVGINGNVRAKSYLITDSITGNDVDIGMFIKKQQAQILALEAQILALQKK